MSVLEVFDGCSSGSLELDNGMTIIIRLGVNDNLKFQALVVHDALECLEIDPQVVSVENLEFADWTIFKKFLEIGT